MPRGKLGFTMRRKMCHVVRRDACVTESCAGAGRVAQTHLATLFRGTADRMSTLASLPKTFGPLDDGYAGGGYDGAAIAASSGISFFSEVILTRKMITITRAAGPAR